MKRKILFTIIAITVALSLPSCNDVDGLLDDYDEAVNEYIEEYNKPSEHSGLFYMIFGNRKLERKREKVEDIQKEFKKLNGDDVTITQYNRMIEITEKYMEVE